MAITERDVSAAWDRLAPVWTERVRAGADLYREVNGLVEAGFRIARIHEPRPTAAMAAAHPWLARWREHAAIFLYVAAEKPGPAEPARVR